MSSIATTTAPQRLWCNARLATMGAPDLGLIEDGAVLAAGERIIFAGPRAALPRLGADCETIDVGGRWITPGLIDCHTHLVHGGNRANEFQARLNGATYQQIAAAGGGILATLRATRAASAQDLIDQALPRLDALLAEGVTAIEIKSGYGLDLAHERRMLQAARKLAELRQVDVHTTFLGAHAVPPEMQGNADAYVDLIVTDMLPTLAAEGLIDSVDGFCEHIAFSPQQIQRVFDCATRLGLPVRLHADQLTNLHGAALAAGFGALSADHLEFTDEAGASAMARAGTVAVLLPGAFYFLRETTQPPIELLRRHGVAMAVATDCNPGTSPLTSLLLAMNMAATQFRLTVEECLIGVTRAAAQAIGRHDLGTLQAGQRADLAIWEIDSPADLVYRMGFNPLHSRIWRGR